MMWWEVDCGDWYHGKITKFWLKKNALKFANEEKDFNEFVRVKNKRTGERICIKEPDRNIIYNMPI